MLGVNDFSDDVVRADLMTDSLDAMDVAVHAAERAIADELAELASATRAIGPQLAAAIDVLSATRGKIIVSGIGKSGHVGSKMAATFASTGSPAFFVHSAEALHGDSGMCAEGDTALLISNSGATVEVCAFARMIKDGGLPLIAMTQHADSELGRLADVVVELRYAREADPLRLAPTTSTTLTLLLCDALAVGLMALSGFTAEEFGVRHPGGSLGKLLSSQGLA